MYIAIYAKLVEKLNIEVFLVRKIYKILLALRVIRYICVLVKSDKHTEFINLIFINTINYGR